MDREQFNKEFFRYLECGSCADLEFCNKYEIPACSTGSAMYRKFKLEDLETENDQLKQQLAEKEKEIEELKKGVYKVTLGTTSTNQIDFTENFYVIQNQTAITELEKARTRFGDYLKGLLWNETILVGKACNMINEIIDQQIKELKGEK